MTAPAPPRIRRVNHGRGHSYYLNDVKVDGATTILGDGYPKQRPLVAWATKEAGFVVRDQWDLLAGMTPDDRFEWVRTASNRVRDAAARRGTEVHDLAQRYMAGEDIPVPDELEGHVDAYIAFVKEWEPRELLVETPIASVRFGYCGTLDVIADLADGHRWLYDLKTTRSGVYRESVCQLAAYRHADFYLDRDGEVQPMVEVDRCGVVWLRADRTYEFVPVEANEQALLVFRAAQHIARFEKRDDYIGGPLSPPNGRSPA